MLDFVEFVNPKTLKRFACDLASNQANRTEVLVVS